MRFLEKNEEITGVQKSDGASEYQRQSGDVLSLLIAQCLISACANDPLGGGKNTSGIWVLLLLSHEISVSFCSFFSLILSGGCTLAFQDFFIQLITKPVVTSAL